MLGRSEAEAADRSRLASQTAGKDGRVVNKLQPVNLIVLFEALNGSGDVRAVTNWVRKQIDRVPPGRQGPGSPARAPSAACRSCPLLRLATRERGPSSPLHPNCGGTTASEKHLLTWACTGI